MAASLGDSIGVSNHITAADAARPRGLRPQNDDELRARRLGTWAHAAIWAQQRICISGFTMDVHDKIRTAAFIKRRMQQYKAAEVAPPIARAITMGLHRSQVFAHGS